VRRLRVYVYDVRQQGITSADAGSRTLSPPSNLCHDPIGKTFYARVWGTFWEKTTNSKTGLLSK